MLYLELRPVLYWDPFSPIALVLNKMFLPLLLRSSAGFSLTHAGILLGSATRSNTSRSGSENRIGRGRCRIMMQSPQRPQLIPWGALGWDGHSELLRIEGRAWTLVFLNPFPIKWDNVWNITCDIGVREIKYLNCSKSWWAWGNPSIRTNKTKLISHLWNPFHGSVTSATQQPCILATVSGLYAWFASFPTGAKASLLPVLLFCLKQRAALCSWQVWIVKTL